MNISNSNQSTFSKLRSKDHEKVQSVHTLISATHKMDNEDIMEIDKRTFFLTIPLNSLEEIPKLKHVIYLKVKKVFGYTAESKNISMIICGDVQGTRTNMHLDLGFQQPHYHALIFLPKSIAPIDSFDVKIFQTELRNCLHEIEEIKLQIDKGEKIYNEPFDPQKGSLLTTVSYVIKADTKFIHQNAENFAHSTFPYDKKLESTSSTYDFDVPRIQDLLFKLHLFPEKILAYGDPNRLSDWQRCFRKEYKSAVDSVEKAQVKKRFMDQLRPYKAYRQAA